MSAAYSLQPVAFLPGPAGRVWVILAPAADRVTEARRREIVAAVVADVIRDTNPAGTLPASWWCGPASPARPGSPTR